MAVFAGCPRGFYTVCFLRITPPLRGSRQDEGASPMSRQWGEHLKRLLRPTAQENRKRRRPPTAAAAPGGLAAATPPQGGSDGKMRCGNSGMGFIRWVPSGFLHSLFLTHHSPLEGESARRGRKPDGAPVGGASKAPATPHRPGEPQGPQGRISPPPPI